MQANSTALLRYRFDDAAQLARHLHLADDRMVLFYGDASASLGGARRVALEVVIGNAAAAGPLRGTVLARVEGSGGGSWLQFLDVRLFRKLQRGAFDFAARRQRRLACDLMVEISHEGSACLARLLDISPEGARIAGVPRLRADRPIFTRLAAPARGWPSTLGVAQIVRTSGSEIGVRFHRDDAIATGAMGRLCSLVQESWSEARELAHSKLCCQRGQVLEPPFPHIRARS